MGNDTTNFTEEELLYIYNQEHRITLIPVIVFFGLEVVFGIVGNFLTLYVFGFRYKSCNFRYFVLSLAIIDFLSCVTTIPGEIVTQLFWFDYPVPPICHAKDYFNQFTACAEAALLTIIAIDRYRKVCKPLGWQIKERGAIYSCAGIFFVSALLAIPTPIFWGTRHRVDTFMKRNITVTLCEKEQRYINTNDALGTTAMNGGLVFISLVIILVLYGLIVKQLMFRYRELKRRRSVKPAKGTSETSIGVSSELTSENNTKPSSDINLDDQSTSRSTQHTVNDTHKKNPKNKRAMLNRVRRKTMIGFYLSVIFIITTFVYWLLIVIVAGGILQKLNNREKAAYTFFLRLYFINHVINPVLYGLMDPRFKAEMIRLKNLMSMRACVCLRKG